MSPDHPQQLLTADQEQALELAMAYARIYGTGWLRIDYMRSGTVAARGGFSYEVPDPARIRVAHEPERSDDGTAHD